MACLKRFNGLREVSVTNEQRLEGARLADKKLDNLLTQLRQKPLTERRTFEFIRDESMSLAMMVAQSVFQVTGDKRLASMLIEPLEVMGAAYDRICDRIETGQMLEDTPLARVIPLRSNYLH